MHAPETVAFELRSPFSEVVAGRKYHAPLLTVWHVDPEADGSDDSCGFTYARLNKQERAKAREIAKELREAEYEGVFQSDGKHYFPQRPYMETIFGLFDLLAWRVFRKEVKPRHLPRIFSATCNPTDNLQSLLRSPLTPEDVERLICIVARNFKTVDRRWYQFPRFHFWHWKLQVHPWERLNRWLFTRCSRCGNRFSYGGSGISDGKGLRHFDC